MKSFAVFFLTMMLVMGASLGAPIVPTSTYSEVCADGTHPTSCTYKGTSSGGYETSLTSFTDNLLTGEVNGETISTKVLNTQEFAGSYMYASNWGANDYVSNTFTLSLTTRSSFYSNPGTGVYNAWGSTDVNETRSVFTSDSVWNCFDPTNCHTKGVWTRFDNFSYSGTGWWTNSLNGEHTGGGEWNNSNWSSFRDKGGWDSHWNSLPCDKSPTPEPATYGMMGLGLAALGLFNRRKKNS